MSSTPVRLVLPPQLYDEMLQHARSEYPNECCGILAGTIDPETGERRALRAYSLVNELASPTAYRSEARSILAASKDIDARGLAWTAVYHSHPTSPPIPSRTDLANNYHGDQMVYVIVSLITEPATVRAWRLFETGYEEVEWNMKS